MIRIVAESSPGEIRIAVIAGGALLDYAIWRPGRPDGLGDIHRARVLAHVPAMAGAFVALPDGDAFLPDSDGGARAIEGELLTVRTTRAAQAGKGARVSATIDQTSGNPGLLVRGPSPLEELAVRHSTASVTVDDPALAAELQPLLARTIEIDRNGLHLHQDAVDALSSPDIDLPSGMRASIHPTPALVAIDLDMAAATATRATKQRAQLAANLAALPAVARQIRLRNLSGAILIDPAGISAKRRAQLAPALTAALASDPLQPRLLGFTALGLAEILRPRLRPALHELLSGPHAAALAALRAIDSESTAAPHARFHLIAAPNVVAALEADTIARAALARRTGRPLILRPDPALSPGGWRIERGA